MATLIVETPEGVELKLELAGAGSRLAAGLLDLLWFLLGLTVLGLALLALSFALPGAASEFLTGVFLGGGLLLAVAFPFAMHVRGAGASPGKSVLGLRVTSADGSPARPLQHLLRALILPVDLIPTGVSLGLVLIAALPRATRLGDLAAGTVVLRERRTPTPWRTSSAARWSEPGELAPVLAPDAAARLELADVEFLRELRDREHVEPVARAALERDAAAVYARRLGFPEPRSALAARAALAAVLAVGEERTGPKG